MPSLLQPVATRPPAPTPSAPRAAGKFSDPLRTARGELRARVGFGGLETLWVNTGTQCNIACRNCYIESSPRNDALLYMTAAEVAAFLDEAAARSEPLREVGFTGGEPFLNRDLAPMLADVLARGLRALVLTNAMRPMLNHRADLLRLRDAAGAGSAASRLALRVSLDHHDPAPHDAERGPGSFAAALEGLRWLAREGFRVAVAGRAAFGLRDEAAARAGYAQLFAAHALPIDAADPAALVLFPEMDAAADVPEITDACWDILNRAPDSVMCASSRMVVRRRGAARPAVVACTLLPHDPRFELGATLAEASGAVALNHPHCARFCVLGGAVCSR